MEMIHEGLCVCVYVCVCVCSRNYYIVLRMHVYIFYHCNCLVRTVYVALDCAGECVRYVLYFSVLQRCVKYVVCVCVWCSVCVGMQSNQGVHCLLLYFTQ